ncbi:HNH endonuclease [Nocardioides baekrokdamisoli]|uniref:HNH endonuclease n=1 Tax=Nocardioides baekrokdamisoli TaxID=1804624 RepID=A0A3G9IAL9_9ACTN|nr:HNH endonuclease signature motif containing protein [Nocardioides baekrokdamisoli]BBH15797.1 HNH endonuclease [Nocardioides baekrokdamisoli]
MTASHDTHPVLACVRGIQTALTDIADLDPTFMPTKDKASALIVLSKALAAASALHARLLASAGDVAMDHGARDAAGWLAAEEYGDYRTVRRSLDLGRSLESAPVVLSALAEGRIDVDKAQIILRALDGLPADVPGELRDRAEVALVEQAAELPPKALARVARHLEAVVHPEAADAAEAKALLREERSAWEKTSLRILDRFDGTARITGVLPAVSAQRLRTYLEAHAQPRKHDGEHARSDQLAGQAFCDLLERINPDTVPRHGGDATVVMVTIPLADLRAELGAASIGGADSDHRISAAEARRLACTAEVIPAVLGGRSQVLDLGRAQRLFTPGQRKALRTRHSTCQVQGCDVPSTWCDAHHEDPWSRGGRTDLNNALLVCGHHHRRLHDTRYLAVKVGSQVQLHRRT